MAIIACLLVVILPVLFNLLNKPKLFLYYVAIIGIMPMTWIGMVPTPVGTISVTAIKLLGILLGSLIGISQAHRPLTPLLIKSWPFALFFTVAAISIAWSPSISMGIRMMLKLATPYVFGLYIALYIQSIGFRQLGHAILFSGLVSIIFALVSTASGLNRGYIGWALSSNAVFSAHMLAVFCVAFSMALAFRKKRYYAFAAITALCILGAFTRITIAGLFIASGVILFFHLKGAIRLAVPIIGFIALVALFLTVDVFKERMFTHHADSISLDSAIQHPEQLADSVAGSGRYAAWQSALNSLFEPHPVFGSGIGASQAMFYGSNQDHLGVMHSEYIRLLCDLGIVGLSVFILAFLYATIDTMFLNTRRFAEFRQIRLAALGAISSYLVFFATDNGIDYAGQYGVFVYALWGASLSAGTLRVRKRQSAPIPSQQSALGVMR